MCTTLLAPVPPMFWARPRFAPLTCRLPALPRSCVTSSWIWATPVAPTGCPLLFRPPLALTGMRAAERGLAGLDGRAALTLLHEAERLRDA